MTRRLAKLTLDDLESISELNIADRAQSIGEDVELSRGDDQVDLIWIDVRLKLSIGSGRMFTGHGKPDHRAGRCGRG
jgi:hypothetical protein